MIYQYSSIKEVIGNVIRNTGLTDSSYILDMPEWIGEAMSFMRTKMELVPRYKDIVIDFHAGKMPVGCAEIEAIEYNGYSLDYKYKANLKAYYSMTTIDQPQSAYQADELIFLTEFAQQCNRLPSCGHSYYTEMGYIKTSFCDGTIRVYFKSMPMDEDEFPLIPDNANYKQALYWHSRAMMIGAGYEDKIFNYEYCDAQYEKYAARAIAGIRYPSTDMVEQRIPTIDRFLPDNYLSYFGMGSSNIDSSCGTTGFIAEMPVSKTDAYIETVITAISVNTLNFTYHSTGSEGTVVTITDLIGKSILQLFLDSYLLEEQTNTLTTLTTNTFRFNTLTGTITLFNALTADQIIQGLRTI